MKYEVKIAPKGKVAVDLRVEFAGIAVFTAWLYPKNGKAKPKIVFQGASDDNEPDVFSLPPARELFGRLCVVEALVASGLDVKTTVGARVNVSQAGVPIFAEGLLEKVAVEPMSAGKFLFFLRFEETT
jgi:hypothetical protein